MDYIVDNLHSNTIKKAFESDMLLSFVILFLIVKLFSIVSVINIPNIPHNIFFADVARGVLNNMVNNERVQMGYAPLLENAELDTAAQLKAQDMINKGYFAHISPDGKTPWAFITESGYKYKYAGENLAVGFYDSQDVFQAWLNSPSHRENLLNPNYREVGTAVLSGFGENKVNIIVQLFGTPLASNPVILNQQLQKVQLNKEPDSFIKNNTVKDETTGIAKQDAPKEVLGTEALKEKETSVTKNESVISYEDVIQVNKFLEDYSYITFILAIGFLLLLIILNFHHENKENLYSRKFILRSTIIIAFLILSLLIDKDFIISVVPHTIII